MFYTKIVWVERGDISLSMMFVFFKSINRNLILREYIFRYDFNCEK